jgi:hypothetical protein
MIAGVAPTHAVGVATSGQAIRITAMWTPTRRTLLGHGAVAAGALALGMPAAAQSRSQGAAPPERLPWSMFRCPPWNAQTLFALGASAAGTAEVGEIMETVRVIREETGDPDNPSLAQMDALVSGWLALGRRLERQARTALAAGHRVTARGRFLRASTAYDTALFFVLGTSRPDREEWVFQACERCWLEGIALWDPAPVPLAVRAVDQDLPAWLFRPDESGVARPTYVLVNGSDGQNVETLALGMSAALARGYNVVVFEGPGQMSLLFERQIPFVPDWAPILTAVTDVLKARPDVDGSRIAASGISFLGMVLASAAAAGSGLAAVVLQPGAVSYPPLWGDKRSMGAAIQTANAPASVKARVGAEINAGIREAWPSRPAIERWQIRKRGEIFSAQFMRDARANRPPNDYFQMLQATLPFTYADDLTRITIPTLVTHNQNDEFFDLQSRQCYRLLRSLPAEAKRLLPLTVSMGAQMHDQPLGPQVAQELIFDWLDRALGA